MSARVVEPDLGIPSALILATGERALAEDEGAQPDTEPDMVAREVGIEVGAATAGEAAVHVTDEPGGATALRRRSNGYLRWAHCPWPRLHLKVSLGQRPMPSRRNLRAPC